MGARVRVGVIGASRADSKTAGIAYEVGRLLARKGAVLVCGGLSGVMEEAARGAREEGGLTVGILPGDDPSSANPHIDIPIVTGMGNARNVIVVLSSDVIIAIGGSYGTLSEIAHAINLSIPLVGLGTWGIGLEKKMVSAGTPEDAVEKAFRLIGSKGRRG